MASIDTRFATKGSQFPPTGHPPFDGPEHRKLFLEHDEARQAFKRECLRQMALISDRIERGGASAQDTEHWVAFKKVLAKGLEPSRTVSVILERAGRT